MKKEKEEKSKRRIPCPYKIICHENGKQKCPCSLAGTERNQIVWDSLKGKDL